MQNYRVFFLYSTGAFQPIPTTRASCHISAINTTDSKSHGVKQTPRQLGQLVIV